MFSFSFSFVNVTRRQASEILTQEWDSRPFGIKMSVQTTETDQRYWAGLGGAPMKITISYDDVWNNNENGETRDIGVTLEENGLDQDKVKIVNIWVEIKNVKFEKNNVNEIIESGGQYSTTFQVSYTGSDSQITVCLHVDFDYYIYDPYYGSSWWGISHINPICVQVDTNEAPTVTSPSDKVYDFGDIPADDKISWIVHDVNNNLANYTVYRYVFFQKGIYDFKQSGIYDFSQFGSCSHGDIIQVRIEPELESGAYEYRIVVRDDKSLNCSDSVFVKVNRASIASIPFGNLSIIFFVTIILILVSLYSVIIIKKRELRIQN